jgi:hypothetical protein
MDDIQVYERVDSVLQQMLTQKNLQENFQELLSRPDDISLGQKCIRQYLESLNYTFFNEEEQNYKFLFKGKEISFSIFVIPENEIELVPINSKTDFTILFFPKKKEIWRAKSSNITELVKNSPVIKWTDGQSTPHYLIPTSDNSIQQVFAIKNISNELC